MVKFHRIAELEVTQLGTVLARGMPGAVRGLK